MDLLDQSEIDALLEAANEGGEESTAASQPKRDSPGGQAPAAGPVAAGRGFAQLPAEFRVAAAGESLKRILPIKVPVTVRLAERDMKIGHILEMTAGTIIEFSRPADSELDLTVNGVPIGTGNAVKCGENFGLRIIRIEPWTQRLLALGLLR